MQGDFTVVGAKNAVIKDANGSKVTMYCEESTELWFTEYGISQLVNGTTTVNIPADFLHAVNTTVPYMVFVQAEGDSKGLFIETKTTNSFTVKESQQGNSNIAFSYRIVAKRKYFENLRMASPAANAQATSTYMNSQWSTELTERTNRYNQVNQSVTNNTDPNYVISTPLVDPIVELPEPDATSSTELPANYNQNANRLQQTNPVIQEESTMIDPQ